MRSWSKAQDGRPTPLERTLSLVLETVFTKGPLSRKAVSDLTGLSQATVSKAVVPLLTNGWLLQGGKEIDGPGRPSLPLRVNSDYYGAIGVAILPADDRRPDRLAGVVIGFDGEIRSSRATTIRDTNPVGVIGAISRLAKELLRDSRFDPEGILGLGVTLPGHIYNDTVVFAPGFSEGWSGLPLGSELCIRTGMNTAVENDANALAVCERLFNRNAPTTWLVTVLVRHEGVGAGLIVDGHLVKGARGIAGEVGHMQVETRGRKCRCGNIGCLETAATPQAIVDTAWRVNQTITDIRLAAAMAESDDEATLHAFRRAGSALGRALANLLNLMNPLEVVLAGPALLLNSAQGAGAHAYMAGLDNSLVSNVFSSAAEHCRLTLRLHEDSHEAVAAAGVILPAFLSNPIAFQSARQAKAGKLP